MIRRFGLMLTADKIGAQSGGGVVTENELRALVSCVGSYQVCERIYLENVLRVHVERGGKSDPDPWQWDQAAVMGLIEQEWTMIRGGNTLVHVYAGTFSETVAKLKALGCKVSYTAAAHSIEESRAEHLRLGFPYDEWFPHMADPVQFKRYVQGYLDADVLIVPSKHSEMVMRSYGATNRIEIIPHGVDVPAGEVKPLPETFTVGALGQVAGPDKGIIYLLQAWKKLNYPDAVLKIAGASSATPLMVDLVRTFGGGNVQLCGWIDSVSDFYDSISCYVQPSVSEGFGIEVIESLAHGRPVVCSEGAGAADAVMSDCGIVVKRRDVDGTAAAIDAYKNNRETNAFHGRRGRARMADYTWEKIRQRYVDVWGTL